MPLIDADTAIALARAVWGDSADAVVYVDRDTKGPGPVHVGPFEADVTVPAVVAFRDEMPGANWMHPCAYALVDAATGTVVVITTSDRPPVFGFLPSTWAVASDPDRRADMVAPPQDQEQL